MADARDGALPARPPTLAYELGELVGTLVGAALAELPASNPAD